MHTRAEKIGLVTERNEHVCESEDDDDGDEDEHVRQIMH
jgi:hypothetical protein